MPAHDLTLSDFDFVLPESLIAQHPAAQRSHSRLLDGRQQLPVDRVFHELPMLLEPSDLLVCNDTRVIKARLLGEKASGGKVELLVERVVGKHEVLAHLRASNKPAPGQSFRLYGESSLWATLQGRWPDENGNLFRLALHNAAGDDPWTIMERHGHVPLPPYIAHADSPEDEQRYQTVFARVRGAVAAPTAALHFDAPVLQALAERGIHTAPLTLHVGAGTFSPVKSEQLHEHRMHSEWYCIPPATQTAIANARAQGRRVVAVGTTVVRALESWAQSGQSEGETCIFITPGFRFQQVDLLLTNFHLPKSTLLMLVSAFAGHAHIMALYRHAIAQGYRFFSYGDAMLLAHKRPKHAAL